MFSLTDIYKGVCDWNMCIYIPKVQSYILNYPLNYEVCHIMRYYGI